MPPLAEKIKWMEGWRGVGLVMITYIYFLIFAQFGFLKHLANLGIARSQIKIIMGAMAVGGITSSLLASRIEGRWAPVRLLQFAYGGCAIGALAALWPVSLVTSAAVSLLIGGATGLLTVTLVVHLNLWIGMFRPLLKIGLGVGLAYFACNYPPLFESSARTMAIVAAGLCFGGIGLAARTLGESSDSKSLSAGSNDPPFWLVLGCFTALVWLDSAAFFIIQNSPLLKSETWKGATRLWQNGGMHLLAALGSAVLLNRRGLSDTLSIAFVCLACACWFLIEPGQPVLARFLYPLGVSLYSVALVAYPSYLASTRSAPEKARLVGRLYALAGWLGSALGIGMAEDLRRIPAAFVWGAASLFFTFLFWNYVRARKREFLTAAGLLLAARGLQDALLSLKEDASTSGAASPVADGRRVYLAEGCIHCHSQYARPHSKDEVMWGAAKGLIASRAEVPPLIGNRRQGPDLTSVGDRRSALWLNAHFMNPAMLSSHSPMPAYARLFTDGRGDALVAYMQSLGNSNLLGRTEFTEKLWRLPVTMVTAAKLLDGAALVRQHCATCHSAEGLARQTWKSSFKRLPPDFVAGPFIFAPPGSPSIWRFHRIAEIIKFGLPATDMPGHEYLSDEQIAAMALRIVVPTNTPTVLVEMPNTSPLDLNGGIKRVTGPP